MTLVVIQDETAAICRKLGLEPSDVLCLYWKPFKLTATVCLHNANGEKYIDQETGDVATETIQFEVLA